PSRQRTFSHRGHQITMNLLEGCSVSDYIESAGEFYESPFLESLSGVLSGDGLVVDVGAHIGNHTIYFARILGLPVVAFEPNPDAYRLLLANVADNDVEDLVECHNIALSDFEGTVHMSPSDVSNAGSMSVTEEVATDATDGIEVLAAPLDTFHARLDGCTYLKIDVEGHEAAVLRGAIRVLQTYFPHLSVEVLSLDQFDAVSALLGESYVPVGLFNASPTVLFQHTDSSNRVMQNSLVRYGIDSALSYQQRRNWYVDQKEAADRLRNELAVQAAIASAFETQTLELQEDSGRSVPQLDRSRIRALLESRPPDSKQSRVLIVELGGQHLPAALLSLFYGAVDVVRLRSKVLVMSRFVGGQQHASARHILHSDVGEGAAALISLFCEQGNPEFGEISALVMINPEERSPVAANVVDLIPGPYLALVNDPEYHYPFLRFWVAAEAVFVSGPGVLDHWEDTHVVPARILAIHDLETVIGAVDDLLVDEAPIVFETLNKNGATDHKVLLVSYFAPPTTPVSVQRLSYWKDSLEVIAKGRDRAMSVSWLTATAAAAGQDSVMVVPDPGELRVGDDTWGLIRRLRELGLDRLGASWNEGIANFLDTSDHRFDTVVMSGNPFYYFLMAPLFKECWGSRVVLDFRDPFAWNPRFNLSVDQRAHLMDLERQMVDACDAVVSVNEDCLRQISPQTHRTRVTVANGFNGEVVDRVLGLASTSSSTGPGVRIVYSGTVFRNLPLDPILDALPPGGMILEHYGRDYSHSNAIKYHPNGRAIGLLPYEAMVAEMANADAGLVLTTGESSTQTTKIFDYIACDLDIIVVTNGDLRTGNLHETTNGLEGVFWVRNDPNDLRTFFASYVPTESKRKQRKEFSRKVQTERLVDLILSLEDS
ncbi:MAG TPA: FkbM family methyltransferase, partial [Acidimicrobiia bacterium]